MDMKTDNSAKFPLSKKQWALFFIGLILLTAGISLLCFYGFRKVKREIEQQKLLKENPVIMIPAIGIEAPILEGTDNDTLSKAVGHFEGTGSISSGNYCIAGHSSTIYEEYFNEIKSIEIGMEILVFDNDVGRTKSTYIVSEYFIVEPNETWILGDFGDNRITLVTCTDDGTQRQIVVGKLKE